ncbi:MAG: apolipoprotein N-acyltransferase [Acidobacteria bacterium]|nr:apolipoprotein N-acyltransferase [Acidobacteriota bacterium]
MLSSPRPFPFRHYQAACLAIASGILQILLFPKFSLSWVSWVALVPLLIALFREASWKRALSLGWIFGLIFLSGCCYWILDVLQGYGDMHWTGALLLFALLIAYLSLFPGLFACAFSRLSLSFPGGCFLLAPCLWVATEYLRGHLLTGFPWCLTGYALVDHTSLTRIATFTGVYGLSFLVVLINALVAGLFFRSKPAVVSLPVALAFLGGLIWTGTKPLEANRSGKADARLVQTHIPLDHPWDPQSQSRLLDELIELSLSPSSRDSATTPEAAPPIAAPHRTRLLIWPETPAPFYFHEDPSFRRNMNRLAESSGSTLLFGFVDWPMEDSGLHTGPYNSVGTLSPAGGLIAQYDKMHLVPFGEYVPWSWLFFFVEKISTGVGDYRPGSRVVVSRLESGERVGVFICYEAVVPDLVRRFVAEGAEVLVNITNDAWFGSSAAPHQHLLMARMRAVENRRYLLRAANSGISAVIDPLGRVLSSTGLHRRTVLDGHFRFRQTRTFYSRNGDLFAWLCLALTLIPGVAASGRRPLNWLRRHKF